MQNKKKSKLKLIWKIKKLFRLIFFLIFLPFKIIKWVFKTIKKIILWIKNHPQYQAFIKATNKYFYPILKHIKKDLRQKIKIEKIKRLEYGSKCSSELVEVLGGIDNIDSITSSIYGIFIKIEIPYLVEKNRLSEFGIIWNDIENDILSMAFGLRAKIFASMLKYYIKISKNPPRPKRVSSTQQINFNWKYVSEQIQAFILKVKTLCIQIYTYIISLKEKAIKLWIEFLAWFEKKKLEFNAWYKKQKDNSKLRKIARDKRRKARKLANIARRQQMAIQKKQKKARMAVLRKQQQALKANKLKAKRTQAMATKKAKLQARKMASKKRR